MNEAVVKIDVIETKLASARTRLILDKPFLGALVLRLPMVAANGSWCPTTATDAKTFYYNPEYIDSLTMSQTQFMLAHEALHCALSHFARRQHRIKHRWDLACDFAINPLLIDDGLIPPPETVIVHQYKGMTAEEIYPLLDDNDEIETLDKHVYDKDENEGGAQNSPPPNNIPPDQSGNRGNESGSQPEQQTGQKPEHDPQSPPTATPKPGDGNQADQNDGAQSPPPLTPQEKETLAVQWQQRMAGAAQQAMQAGKLDGSMARMIDHLLQPQLPWRMLLAHYMTSTARDDFSYMRPSRREGTAILPSLRSSQINIGVAVDTSGSIKYDEISEFISEVNALKAQIRARITLLPCDTQIAKGAPFVFEPWDEIELPEIHGGGGTSFVPVFDWLSAQDTYPDLLVYFTDAEGIFPGYQPPYPVIWLVKGKTKTPWGQRIQLN
jgi:predicted metal-dependent peptidase